MSALDYIHSMGLEYHREAGQLVLRECPFCGDKGGHFYISQSDDGPFFCHKCQEKGNLFTFKRHLGGFDYQDQRPVTKKASGKVQPAVKDEKQYVTPDEQSVSEAHSKLLADKQALDYLADRKINMETIVAFKLGLKVTQNVRWLSIPHYEAGKLVNIKSRSLPPAEKTFRRVENCRSILFNVDVLKEHRKEIYLCEGELDAIILWQEGIKNVLAVTAGAGSFLPEWVDALVDMAKIYICYDADDAGQKGARELARRLGYERCFNVVLPDGLDVNEFFQAGHDLFDFQTLVKGSRLFDVAGITSFADCLLKYKDEINRPNQETGIRTGWKDVDRIIKTGLRPGELTILSAPPKIGKSTFALQIAICNVLLDIPSLFFCLEMRPLEITEKAMKCHARKERITEIERINANQKFRYKPFYLGYSYQRPTLDGIIGTLKEAIKRYDLKLVIFDHLHFLCRSVSNQVQEVGLAVQGFKFLAMELEVPIILIAQPRKIQSDACMTAMDLKDSSSIFSDCDHLIILHRKRKTGSQTEAYEPVTLVRIEASRYNAGGDCMLYFHGNYSRFEEMVQDRESQNQERGN